jgi:hypothetical protein
MAMGDVPSPLACRTCKRGVAGPQDAWASISRFRRAGGAVGSGRIQRKAFLPWTQGGREPRSLGGPRPGWWGQMSGRGSGTGLEPHRATPPHPAQVHPRSRHGPPSPAPLHTEPWLLPQPYPGSSISTAWLPDAWGQHWIHRVKARHSWGPAVSFPPSS